MVNVYDPPPPPNIPLDQPSGGTPQGYFPVGYSGTGGAVGQQVGPPLQPQFPWGGYQDAWNQYNQGAESGLNALTGGMAVSSPFGQQVGQLFSSPYGLPPELLAQQRRMLAETAAGSRENALGALDRSANASGFGNSAAKLAAAGQIRTQSAADLNNANTQLSIQDALLQLQRQQAMGGIMGGLYGTDAAMRQAYAQGQLGRQYPIYPGQPGQSAPWGGSGQPGWSQSGQYLPQGYGYDPFTPQQTGSGAPTNYSPQQPWSPW